MIENGKSNKGALIGALLVLVALGLYVFYGRGLAERNAVLTADLEGKNTELTTFITEKATLDKAKEELSITGSTGQFLSLTAIPVELGQDQVIKTIVEVAKSFDIELNSISFSKAGSDVDNLSTLRVNASFEGNYSDLTDFLEGLEQNGRLFKVNNINVQINSLDFSGLERANFSLTIDTFYQEQK